MDHLRIYPGIQVLLAGLLALGLTKPPQALAADENLALRKPYVLSPAPNYPLCAGDDNTKLTDGNYTSGYFWKQRSTAGWQSVPSVAITIDLGASEPIDGVSFNSAAGTAGVHWPNAIWILVSDDQKTFYDSGELISLSARLYPLPAGGGYAVHRFLARGLRARGRYVTLLISPSEFTFVDEIEVCKGESFLMEQPRQGKPISDLKAFYKESQTRWGIDRRVTSDIRSIRQAAAQTNISTLARNVISKELDAAEAEQSRGERPLDPGFKAVLPLNATHEKAFRAQARLWRELGAGDLTAWTADPYAPLTPAQAPPRQACAPIPIAMMENEHRAGAFNLANASEKPVSLDLQIVDLPGGINPPYVSVNEVLWTDTKSGIPVACALAPAPKKAGGFGVTVFPGLLRQIWLTFHPVNIPPGVYNGRVLLSFEGQRREIPLALRIYPSRFPDKPSLHSGGFDYTDGENPINDITAGNRQQVIEILRDHYIDSPWASSAVFGPGQYDASGHMTVAPDTARFDQWLERWPNASQYCVFADVKEQFAGSPMGTPEFAGKVTAWAAFWAKHAASRGLKPRQVLLLLVDEPNGKKKDQIILGWARVIRAAHTGMRLWENLCHRDPSDAIKEMVEACDVLCPNRVAFINGNQSYRDYFAARQEAGTEMSFYSCSGPARDLDPCTYYRLQAWWCWSYWASSSYFWSFSDAGGGSCWNEYSAGGCDYAPFFLDATSVLSSKQLEALREGLEDYEYLIMLRSQIAKAEKEGAGASALARAKALLKEGPKRVSNAAGATSFAWADEKNRGVADQVRIEILESLAALRGAGGKEGAKAARQ